ncbi:MAG: hypothetical protein LIP28_04570, partial [Deltaproteobacteria bacterium]|nr:hypothetical protein [Deltaproteobacteria bacterium]
RLAAQERNGVPEDARRVLTRAEARFLAGLAARLAEAEEAVRVDAFKEFRDRLGRYAERAFDEVAAAMEGRLGGHGTGDATPGETIQGGLI